MKSSSFGSVSIIGDPRQTGQVRQFVGVLKRFSELFAYGHLGSTDITIIYGFALNKTNLWMPGQVGRRARILDQTDPVRICQLKENRHKKNSRREGHSPSL